MCITIIPIYYIHSHPRPFVPSYSYACWNKQISGGVAKGACLLLSYLFPYMILYVFYNLKHLCRYSYVQSCDPCFNVCTWIYHSALDQLSNDRCKMTHSKVGQWFTFIMTSYSYICHMCMISDQTTISYVNWMKPMMKSKIIFI